MTAPAPLTLVEVGERWPDALVLWDRDVASPGWAPVFCETAAQSPGSGLFAFDRACEHATGTPAWNHIDWDECRCVTWTGTAWITMYAERHDAVSSALGAALRGAHVPLEPAGSQVLWYMLPNGCDAAITASSFIVPYIISGHSDEYDPTLAPGIVSFLLDGVGLPDTGHAIRRIRLGARLPPEGRAPPGQPQRFPVWDEAELGARYVRIDDDLERIVLRIRASEADLARLGPEVPVVHPQQHRVLDRACPHCGRIPERYRVLQDGAHVCLACGRSMRAP